MKLSKIRVQSLQYLVEVVDGVVEGEEDELRDLVRLVPAGDILTAAVTVLETAIHINELCVKRQLAFLTQFYTLRL